MLPIGSWVSRVVVRALLAALCLAALPLSAATPGEATRPIEGLGIELMSVGLSASGYMIDLRYRVVDAARAQALAERKVSPVLINTTTGHRYYVPSVPKIGPLRQSATVKQPLLAGRTYFMLFANPDRRLQAGERVSLQVGDAVVQDIVVR